METQIQSAPSTLLLVSTAEGSQFREQVLIALNPLTNQLNILVGVGARQDPHVEWEKLDSDLDGMLEGWAGYDPAKPLYRWAAIDDAFYVLAQ